MAITAVVMRPVHHVRREFHPDHIGAGLRRVAGNQGALGTKTVWNRSPLHAVDLNGVKSRRLCCGSAGKCQRDEQQAHGRFLHSPSGGLPKALPSMAAPGVPATTLA